MELQTAKYFKEYKESEFVAPKFDTFVEPADPASLSKETNFKVTVVTYCSMFVIFVCWCVSMYTICKVFRLPLDGYGRSVTIVKLAGLVIDKYCRSQEQYWMAYGVSSGLLVLALVLIGCMPRTMSSHRACNDSLLTKLALTVGEQLRGSGSYSFAIATTYMLVGTITAFTGITWMITLYQEQERGAVSVILMSMLSQVGAAASIGGAISLMRAGPTPAAPEQPSPPPAV